MASAKIFTGIVFALCFACTSAWAGQEKSASIVSGQNLKETSIVRLHFMGGIQPAELIVKPGTTVVWVNDSRAQLELQFQGKQVTMACKSPVHFLIDDEGSFISDRIPPDSVASLCFVEKGEFTYVLRKVGSSAYTSRSDVNEFKGKIIVQ